MKYLISPTLLLMMFCSFAIGQTSGGPDSYGYTWKDNNAAGGPAIDWINITSIGTQVTGLGDDNFVGPFDIGFTFDYYWNNPSQFYIGSNGYIAFDNGIQISSGGTLAFPTIPTADANNNFLAPFISDFNFGGAGNPGAVYYYTNNVDSLIITFLNVPFWNNVSDFTGMNTFQVIISGVDNSIVYQYQSQSGTYDPAYNGTTNPVVYGIENINGTIGLQVGNALPTAPRAVKFEYPDTVTFSVVDVKPNWIQNARNYGYYELVGAPYIVEGSVSNVGNTGVGSSFNVQTQVYATYQGNPVGAPLYNEVFNIGGMTQNQTINYSYGPLYTPGAVGNYIAITQTQLSGDLISGNDVIQTEIVTLDTAGLTEVTIGFVDGGAENLFGFEGGAVYYHPPFYPAEVTSLQFGLFDGDTTVTSSDDFHAKLFDDDGPNGAPGTLLFDSIVAGADVVTINAAGQLHNLIMDNSVTFNDGGFYISWETLAATQNTNILEDETAPFSLRSFEVLSGSFGPYRDAALADLFIFATINVSPADTSVSTPVANFSASSFTTCAGGSIQFFNQTLNGTSVAWTFENGTPPTASTLNPISTFTTTGMHEVTMIVSNSAGSDTSTQFVNVLGLPTAGLMLSADTVEVGQFLGLTSTSTDATANNWNFGDGLTGAGDMTFHAYAASGAYTIIITASNPCGTDFDTTQVYVIDTMTTDTSTGIIGFQDRSQIGLIESIYPNPTSNVLFFKLTASAEKIELFSADGRLVNIQSFPKIKNDTYAVDVTGLNSGLYFLKVFAGKGFQSVSFVVNK